MSGFPFSFLDGVTKKGEGEMKKNEEKNDVVSKVNKAMRFSSIPNK